ncbi:MAG: endopeptidase La [Bacteroidaceae bacterium]|nr:endopeptidase La [Bacteroidaceae bacterium]
MNDFPFDEFMEEASSEGTLSFIANIDKSKLTDQPMDSNEPLPVLPVRNVMLFPLSILPISVGRKPSLKIVQEASAKNSSIAVFSQKDDSVEEPTKKDLYKYGCLAKVLKVINLPDGTKMAVIQGFQRIKLIDLDNSGAYLTGHVENAPEEDAPSKSDRYFKALIATLKETSIKCFKSSNPSAYMALTNITEEESIINFICTNIDVTNEERYRLLSANTLVARANALLTIVDREYQFISLKNRIQHDTRESLNKQQREYFLRQEIQNIQQELGEEDSNSDIAELTKKAATKKWDEKTQEAFNKVVKKLKRVSSQSPEYQVEYNYAQTMLSLPWNECTKDNLNINNAEKVLNADHYGMDKVKERILEHLAVLKMRGDFKSPIICLYGPPGVGKTSLGKSIAKAMKRKYVRISLGGLHDESEIRGHRRTYIGAMPGRIINGIAKAGSSNPVFILDEIDKITQQNINGDPASALLEVLDPEQNTTFHDNYLDIDFDLSKVMFIATANNIGAIPAPLLDRMELIEVSGYLTEEKIEIAKRHLIPKNLENLGMSNFGVKIAKTAIEQIIEKYTRESGVRNLDKQINKMLRKAALNIARSDDEQGKIEFKPADLTKYLGPEPYNRDKYQGNDYAGVVTGLAWTAVGGEILFIETSLSKGKAGKLTLTGNLGDVMKESAVLALEYLKAHHDMLGIRHEIFDFWNIHIHVPEGATPKDGPSAGITIATSLASALTQRKVRPYLAMTGEITLRGKVLPVGGIKEKILAAKRAGIKDIMICHENRKDIEQIPEKYVTGVTFHYVENVKDVLDFALLDEKVANPIDLEAAIEEKKEEKK